MYFVAKKYPTPRRIKITVQIMRYASDRKNSVSTAERLLSPPVRERRTSDIIAFMIKLTPNTIATPARAL